MTSHDLDSSAISDTKLEYHKKAAVPFSLPDSVLAQKKSLPDSWPSERIRGGHGSLRGSPVLKIRNLNHFMESLKELQDVKRRERESKENEMSLDAS